MAKQKSNDKNRARGNGDNPRVKLERKSLWGGVFHFIVSPLVWRLILLVIIVAVLFWQWGSITSWFADVTESTVELFGWGLVLIAIAVIVIMGLIWRRQLSAWAHRWKLHQWNKGLGAIAFIFAVWGILALFNLGGSFGLHIINHDQGLIGILCILGLVVLGVILVASVFTYRPWCRLLCPFGTMAWLTSRFSRFKIRRNENCTDCKLCEKICPTSEAFTESTKAECYLCNLCVDNCPANALEYTKK